MDVIAADPEPTCYLCGSRGTLLHEDLVDKWCGAPGSWSFRRCPKQECGLVWLDPIPGKDEVWKAYRGYFTHRNYAPGARKIDRLDLFLMKIHKPLYKFVMYAAGFRRVEKEWRKKSDEFYLGDAIPGGRLLDVGCGRGDFLDRMRRQGWIVEGVEVDAEAVEYARATHGLMIHLGALESLRLPADSFDAVTMNQVIEHVHDPVSLIRECLRLLKPGGRLVIGTPNVDCLGYRTYGRSWSHLDPPRHLHLFTKNTLRECVARAGFRSIEVRCAPGYAEGDIQASIERVERPRGTRREFSKWLEASVLKIRAYYLFFVKKDEEAGEDVVLVARKDG